MFVFTICNWILLTHILPLLYFPSLVGFVWQGSLLTSRFWERWRFTEAHSPGLSTSPRGDLTLHQSAIGELLQAHAIKELAEICNFFNQAEKHP